MNNGGVKMDLKPHSFEDGTLRVKFFANTHSANLGDYDLATTWPETIFRKER